MRKNNGNSFVVKNKLLRGLVFCLMTATSSLGFATTTTEDYTTYCPSPSDGKTWSCTSGTNYNYSISIPPNTLPSAMDPAARVRVYCKDANGKLFVPDAFDINLQQEENGPAVDVRGFKTIIKKGSGACAEFEAGNPGSESGNLTINSISCNPDWKGALGSSIADPHYPAVSKNGVNQHNIAWGGDAYSGMMGYD